MPTATMTSAPKKKRDFYNGSQGLNFRDFRSPEPQETQDEGMVPAGPYVLNGRRTTSGSYHPASPVGFPPSQDVGGHSSADYSFPAPFLNRPSPAEYYSQTPQDRCSSGFIRSRSLDFDDSAPLAEAPGPCTFNSTAEHPSWTGPPQAPPPGDGDGEGDDGKKKSKKRKQRCRMCANHGIYVEIKGHKWYCPYKNLQHNCTKCEITRKRQYFMAKQQQLTREQLQQHHLHLQTGTDGETVVEGGAQAAMPAPLPSKPSDFPRMKELLEETDHILDEDLFRQIDECVRPKVTHH